MTSMANVENWVSVQYWPKKSLFWEKGHKKYHHPLFNPFSKCFLHQKKSFQKGAASDCRTHKKSRLGLASWNLNIQNPKIWFSRERIELVKWSKNIFLISQVLSFSFKNNIAKTLFSCDDIEIGQWICNA